MRHKTKVFLISAASGAALALACVRTTHGQISLQKAIAQRGVASAAKLQQMQGEITPANTVAAALQALASQAAVVFTGSVVKLTELPGSAARVDFAVEDGLRGAASGGSYSMRVSAWAGGLERYRVGERALFLLHAPSLQGFSSPVGGELGIIPLAGDALVGSVDLRWVGTAVQRTVATSEAASNEILLPVMSAASVPFVSDATATAPSNSHLNKVRGASLKEQLAASNVTGNDVHAIDRDLVTGMLRTWTAAAGITASPKQDVR